LTQSECFVSTFLKQSVGFAYLKHFFHSVPTLLRNISNNDNNVLCVHIYNNNS